MKSVVTWFICMSLVIAGCSSEHPPPQQHTQTPEELTVTFYKTYEVNAQGEKVKFLDKITQQEAETQAHIKVTYNKAKELIKDELFDENKQRTNYTRYFYDNGQKVKEEFYTEHQTLTSEKHFNTKQQLVKERHHTTDYIQEILYTYNTQGQLLKETHHDEAGNTLFYKNYSYQDPTIKVDIYTPAGVLISSTHGNKKETND